MDGQSFAPNGLRETDTASDCLLIKRHCTGRAKMTMTNLCSKFAISFVFCCPAYATSGNNKTANILGRALTRGGGGKINLNAQEK